MSPAKPLPGRRWRTGTAATRFRLTRSSFGSGGTCLIEGTNDGTNWYTLTDPQGVALSITTAGIYQVIQVTLKMRPRVSAGDGTTALVVTGLLRRTHNAF